jgi:glycosyltransferase involved in cell wall biosynthesis
VVGGSYTTQFSRDVLHAAGDLPTITYLFDIEGVELISDPFCARTHVVANAEAIASLVVEHRNRPPVVPCIVEGNDYKVATTREVVLYINPHPRKGEHLAWAIAEAAPGLRFVFQESWRIKEERRREIIERAQKLGNVEFRGVIDRPEEVYRDARVLLAPYGPERPRVVDEALACSRP